MDSYHSKPTPRRTWWLVFALLHISSCYFSGDFTFVHLVQKFRPRFTRKNSCALRYGAVTSTRKEWRWPHFSLCARHFDGICGLGGLSYTSCHSNSLWMCAQRNLSQHWPTRDNDTRGFFAFAFAFVFAFTSSAHGIWPVSASSWRNSTVRVTRRKRRNDITRKRREQNCSWTIYKSNNNNNKKDRKLSTSVLRWIKSIRPQYVVVRRTPGSYSTSAK